MPRYRVYADYIFTKIIADDVDAPTEGEAVEKALEEATGNVTLCYHCSGEFVEGGVIDEDSCSVEIIS